MSFQLPESIAINLLDKLGNDDAFREVFAADPRQALAQLGFGPAADPDVREGLWKCFHVNALASKQTILTSRDTILRQLMATRAAMNPISLEIEPGGERHAA